MLDNAEEAEKASVRQTLLEKALEVSRRGGNWHLAMPVLLKILHEGTPEQQIQVLQRLQVIGDAKAAGEIVSIMDDAKAEVLTKANEVLIAMPGREVTLRIVDVFPQQPDSVKISLSDVLAQKGGPQAVPALLEAAGSENAELRTAAYEAIGKLGSADALDALLSAAQKADDDEAGMARTIALYLIGSILESDDPAQLGKAWAAKYRLAESTEERIKALNHMAKYPAPEAYEIMVQALEKEELRPVAKEAAVAVAAGLYAARQPERALELYEAVRPTYEKTAVDAPEIRYHGGLEDASRLGVLSHWWLAGPFKVEDVKASWNEEFVDVDRVNPEEDEKWREIITSDSIGDINLASELGAVNQAFAYAFTRIDVDEKTPAQLRIGSDDGLRVWINGQEVHDHLVERGAAPDSDIVSVTLQPGENRILLRISQGAGGWGFCARITDQKGLPLVFSSVEEE